MSPTSAWLYIGRGRVTTNTTQDRKTQTNLQLVFDVFTEQVTNVFIVDLQVTGVNQIFGVFGNLNEIGEACLS